MRGLGVWPPIAALVLVLRLGLGGAPAYADDHDEARKAFNAGQEADRRKDWQTAIEHYRRANDLVPHPFAIYNIAFNYERLGKLRESAAWYERYLASITDLAERERVQRTLEDLIARPAPLTVRSVPDRARVYIDAVPVGATPHQGTIRGGFHRVSVELDGRRAQRDVTVEYADPVSLEFALRDATGTVSVTGPTGAVIHVGDREAGRVPARLTLSPGVYELRVESPGRAPFQTMVTVEAGREIKVTAGSERAPGGEGEGAGAGPGATPAAGTDPTAGTGARPRLMGYLLGFAGGADVGEGQVLGLVEIGVRIGGRLDFGPRFGYAAGRTQIDLHARWAMLPTRITPVFGGGYAFAGGGTGYILSGGLRWDVLRSDLGAISVLAESGLRYTAEDSGSASSDKFIVPITGSVVFEYTRSSAR